MSHVAAPATRGASPLFRVFLDLRGTGGNTVDQYTLRLDQNTVLSGGTAIELRYSPS